MRFGDSVHDISIKLIISKCIWKISRLKLDFEIIEPNINKNIWPAAPNEQQKKYPSSLLLDEKKKDEWRCQWNDYQNVLITLSLVLIHLSLSLSLSAIYFHFFLFSYRLHFGFIEAKPRINVEHFPIMSFLHLSEIEENSFPRWKYFLLFHSRIPSSGCTYENLFM